MLRNTTFRCIWNDAPSGSGFSSPGVFRFVAEHATCLVDRQQRLVRADCSGQWHAGKLRAEKLVVGARHHGVRVGDDEDVGAGGSVLQCAAYRLCAVTSVNVGPEVPATSTGSASNSGKRA